MGGPNIRFVATCLLGAGVAGITTGLPYIVGWHLRLARHPLALGWGWFALVAGTVSLLVAAELRTPQPDRAAAPPTRPAVPLALLLLQGVLQVEPLWLWVPELLRARGGHQGLFLTMAVVGHAVAGGVALLGLIPACRFAATSRPRAAAWLAALLPAAVAMAAPVAYPWFLNVTWAVTAEPAAGNTIPASAAFRFTWPAWQGSATGGGIRYVDTALPPPQAFTGGGAGVMTIRPQMLLIGQDLVVTVNAGLRRRSFHYRVASEADERVDLYRAALVHWLRSGAGREVLGAPGIPGAPGRPPVTAIGLDRLSMPELNEDQKRQVALGIGASAPLLIDMATGEVTHASESGHLAPRGPDWQTPLVISLFAQKGQDGVCCLVRVAARQGALGMPPVWQTETEMRAIRDPSGWRFDGTGQPACPAD